MKRHTPADLAAAFPRGLPVPTEHEEQVALFQWAALHLWHEPRLELLYAIPNGGARHPAVAAKLKVEGVKPGVPDVCLPVAAGSFHGLYVELKRLKGGTVQPEQTRWNLLLLRQGYRAVVARGWVEAARVICEHLNRPDMSPEAMR